MEEKVNKNPTNYVEVSKKTTNAFVKYQETGIFNMTAMKDLLKGVKDKRKNKFIEMANKPSKTGSRFAIEFRYNTGSYRLILYSSFDMDLKDYWHKLDWIAQELGMLKGTTYETLKYTYFYIDYDDYTIFTLRDLFNEPDGKEEEKIFKKKKFKKIDSIFPWENTIMKEAKPLIEKLKELEFQVEKELKQK